MSTYGERLRDLMALRGVSVADLATHCGVAEHTVVGWLRRITPPEQVVHFLEMTELLDVRARFIGRGTGDILRAMTGETEGTKA